MFAAVRGVHRANPLRDFVVFERRNAFKVSPHNRGEVHWRGVRPNLRDGRRQVHDGIVLRWL